MLYKLTFPTSCHAIECDKALSRRSGKVVLNLVAIGFVSSLNPLTIKPNRGENTPKALTSLSSSSTIENEFVAWVKDFFIFEVLCNILTDIHTSHSLCLKGIGTIEGSYLFIFLIIEHWEREGLRDVRVGIFSRASHINNKSISHDLFSQMELKAKRAEHRAIQVHHT